MGAAHCVRWVSQMADNDEVVQVWYLCGWAYHLMDDHDAAREPLEHALEVRPAWRDRGCGDASDVGGSGLGCVTTARTEDGL